MLYDIQKSEPDSRGRPRMVTDLVSSNRRRVLERAFELWRRNQNCRVVPQYGATIWPEDVVREIQR